MVNFIRRLFIGTSVGIAGIAFLLIKVLGFLLHLYTVYFAFIIKGFWAALISLFLPFLAQLYWVISSVKIFETWINPYSFFVGLYAAIWFVLWIVVLIFGASAGASYKND